MVVLKLRFERNTLNSNMICSIKISFLEMIFLKDIQRLLSSYEVRPPLSLVFSQSEFLSCELIFLLPGEKEKEGVIIVAAKDPKTAQKWAVLCTIMDY